MPIRILDGDVHLLNLKARMPFKYGIATMTECPHAFVRVQVEAAGKTAVGISADHLPPKWFTKDPSRSIRDEILEMAMVIDHAVQSARGLQGETPFEVWRLLWQAQDAFGKEHGLPPLLTHFGTSLAERAMLEGFSKITEKPLYRLARANRLGLKLGEMHAELKGTFPADFLPVRPRSRIVARHTVGMSDPLREADIPTSERLDDGLPQSLEATMKAYGLKHFKIKVGGDIEADLDRLRCVAEIVAAEPEFQFTLDGNEQFKSFGTFRDFWEKFRSHPKLTDFLAHLLFVEQPFHRDIALDPAAVGELRTWEDRPAISIDESDGDLQSLPQALELGYHGTSHKNCKGVFKGIINFCLLNQNAKTNPGTRRIISGEDLANIGPVALLQDLAICAMMGIQSVERNGHHYFAGLSMFPAEVQEQALAEHPDLYHKSDKGWPTLSVENGALNLGTVNRASFGTNVEVDVEKFQTLAQWKGP